MPSNLNKILHTRRQENFQTKVRKIVTKMGDILNICLNKSGLVVVLHKSHRGLYVGYSGYLSRYLTAECCDSCFWGIIDNILCYKMTISHYLVSNVSACLFGTRWISLIFSVIHVSQGSVATYVSYRGMPTGLHSKFPAEYMLVKEFVKSVKIWQS